MELDWYCTGVSGMRQQSCWGILWFFKRPQVSPLEKQRNWQHDIWCIITNTWANRVVIVRYLTLANYGLSRLNLPFTCSVNQCCFYSLPVFHCSSVTLYCCFCSAFVWFILFGYSVFDYSFILELYSMYFDPLSTNNHPAVNKHHTSDSVIFSLSIESESLLPSWTLLGYWEPISPYGLSGGRDNYIKAGIFFLTMRQMGRIHKSKN